MTSSTSETERQSGVLEQAKTSSELGWGSSLGSTISEISDFA